MAGSSHRSLVNLILAAVAVVLVLAVAMQSPAALAPGRTLSPVDALLMATSTVTLCGLSPRDPATVLSPLGMAALIVTAQVFGLILIRASCRIIMGPKSISRSWWRLVGTVLGVEAIGAVLLIIAMAIGSDEVSVSSIFTAAAIAMKAICTGGPTMTATEMDVLRHAWAAHLVVMPMMLIGLLGVPELQRIRFKRRDESKANAPSKAGVSAATPANAGAGATESRTGVSPWHLLAGAYIIGVLAITIAQLAPAFYGVFKLGLEAGHGQAQDLTVIECGSVLADASFTAFSAMSSGISITPISELTAASRVVVMVLMLVGGMPGSAAGGIGLWAVAMLLDSAWKGVRSGGTEIISSRVGLMLAIALWLLGLSAVGLFTLSIIEPYPLATLMFESVSAVTVSGLSTGITGDLTSGGKCVLVVLMLLGRFGTLALWAASWPEKG